MHARQLTLDVLGRVRQPLFDPGDVEINAAMRAPPALFDLLYDTARDMISRQKLRRTPCIFVSLSIAPTFFFVVRRLRFVVLGNRIEHEPLTMLVRQNATFAAHTFRYQNSHHARWPDHSGGMKLYKLHVN